ncbi:hypothetical protein [Brevibacillus reuszeri]|uniref:hypothetical protein n=1 Tax=Brevibacillus reuszeri TaxID=54915 RepID=UPI000CCC5F0C|nr:hypothetical protein [Brevibacillus reuszeri]
MKPLYETLANTVGLRAFMINYELLKEAYEKDWTYQDIKNQLNGEFKISTAQTKVSAGKRIFRLGLEMEVLDLVRNSNRHEVFQVKEKANQLYNCISKST